MELVDFVSIGSNDLVQYLMAADRDNPKVAHLCQPLAPPVLIVLKKVIRACNEANVPVTVCGEMAGKPRAFVLLLGMGLRRFSMSPAFVPSIKQLASQISIEEAEQSRRLRDEIQNDRSSQKIHDSGHRTNRTESENAGFGLTRSKQILSAAAKPEIRAIAIGQPQPVQAYR